MTEQQYNLLRQFVFVDKENQERGATEEENIRYLPYGVQVIVYAACAHSALYDLEAELSDAGLYRHATKRYLQQARKHVGHLHELLYKGIGAHSEKFGRWYNEQFSEADGAINEHISLEAPERAYNITRALLRMAIRANEKCGRFRCPAISLVVLAEKYLDRCNLPIKDYQIDPILARCIDLEKLTTQAKTIKA